MSDFPTNFSTLDWLIVAVYLLGTLAIGLYVNRFVGSMSDYIVAGRSLRSYLGVATMVGSELGLVTVMYAGQTGFTGGLAAMHIGVIAGVITLLIGWTGFIVVPLRRMGVMTIPEFYGKRFTPGVRIFGGLVLAVAGILNMGLFLKAGALFLTALMGLHDPTAVNLVMTALLVLVLIYTILGGMVSVVITDYLQFVVLSVGMIGTCVLAYQNLGWDRIVETVAVVHGDQGFDPFHDEGFGPTYVIWMIFTAGIVSSAVWQTAVMRACAADSTHTVRRLYMWSSIGFLIRFLIPQFLGVCALTWFWSDELGRQVFFTEPGDVVASPEVTLQAMPLFLAQLLPVGLIGLVGAAMLAAFMSTHDSYLLCWASVLAYDVVEPLSRGRVSTKTCLLLARVFIALIGMFLLVWGLWFPLGQNLWDYMAVTGALYFTGAFAVLLAGLYWRKASSFGAYLALASGSFALLGLKPVQEKLPLNWRYSSEVVGIATTLLALVLMFGGSYLVPDKIPPQKEDASQ